MCGFIQAELVEREREREQVKDKRHTHAYDENFVEFSRKKGTKLSMENRTVLIRFADEEDLFQEIKKKNRRIDNNENRSITIFHIIVSVLFSTSSSRKGESERERERKKEEDTISFFSRIIKSAVKIHICFLCIAYLQLLLRRRTVTNFSHTYTFFFRQVIRSRREKKPFRNSRNID